MRRRPQRRSTNPHQRLRWEHRRLDTLLRRTRRALVTPDAEGAAPEAFARLREAVDAHLTQENSLYYPPLRALRPRLDAALRALVGAHEDFRHRLAKIAAHLARGAVAPALNGLDAFTQDFGRHEAREERLLVQLVRELTSRF
jgi:hypothetical protein